ncbi:hypothetical protein ACKI1I_28520 [Streptomyces turgidiscabies]|uniref:Uncharacterized protein n=1 Tax=Streptomyces turgidiscabies (strain Car8) TaxID=698760 RepID=L7EZU7_STRT8|nr:MULTISPECIES: hypothetical protein [Streptomyces]ELP64958.1 hypothetical protein STRTUCAR8_00284 [Streptomyces turgidiscabies Car8]MDX3498207.1 hypothetical protein [Streptomyces turgidiscabies]GAQ75180.1 hypothetical protein T45_06961 [Streptomyces turgidiscabies]
MRWLTLYVRSRQMPASLAVMLISAVAVWALARDGGEGQVDPRVPVLVLATGVMAASVGLSGQDLALDRTASIRWVPRRAAHVLLAGAVVAAVLLLTAAAAGRPMATTAFVVRDSVGLMGLAALGATLSGGQYAWTLPFAWLSFAFFAPPPTNAAMRVATWMMLPTGSATGTGTALVLAITGTVSYAVAGPNASVRFLQRTSFRRPTGE